MRLLKTMREGSKIKAIYEKLERYGQVDNVSVLNGDPVRTNRLSAVIHTLETEFGVKCESNTIRDRKGNYVNCIYKLVSLPDGEKATPIQKTLPIFK